MPEIEPERLSERVIREIERLGGVLEPPPAEPQPLSAFLADLEQAG